MFKENVRAEAQYFKSLKSLVASLSAWKNGTIDRTTEDIIDNCILADKTIIMLYKNLGEAWNELTAYIMHNKAGLEKLKAELESFKDEINEKVDEVNNYLVNRITEIENALQTLQNAFETMHKVHIYKARKINGTTYKIYDGDFEASLTDARNYLDNNYMLFIEYTLSGVKRYYVIEKNETNYLQFTDVYYYADTQRLIVSMFKWTNLQSSPVQYSSKYWEIDTLASTVATLQTAVTDLQTVTTTNVTQYRVVNVASFWVQDPVTGLYQYELPDELPTDKLYTYTLCAGGDNFDALLDNMVIMRSAGVFASYSDDPKHIILNATTVPREDFVCLIKRDVYNGNENFSALVPAYLFIINGV